MLLQLPKRLHEIAASRGDGGGPEDRGLLRAAARDCADVLLSPSPEIGIDSPPLPEDDIEIHQGAVERECESGGGDEVSAATRIQARQRGRSARRRLANANTNAADIEAERQRQLDQESEEQEQPQLQQQISAVAATEETPAAAEAEVDVSEAAATPPSLTEEELLQVERLLEQRYEAADRRLQELMAAFKRHDQGGSGRLPKEDLMVRAE